MAAIIAINGAKNINAINAIMISNVRIVHALRPSRDVSDEWISGIIAVTLPVIVTFCMAVMKQSSIAGCMCKRSNNHIALQRMLPDFTLIRNCLMMAYAMNSLFSAMDGKSRTASIGSDRALLAPIISKCLCRTMVGRGAILGQEQHINANCCYLRPHSSRS